MISDLHTEEYSAEEYNKAYNAIYAAVTMFVQERDGKCAHPQNSRYSIISTGENCFSPVFCF